MDKYLIEQKRTCIVLSTETWQKWSSWFNQWGNCKRIFHPWSSLATLNLHSTTKVVSVNSISRMWGGTNMVVVLSINKWYWLVRVKLTTWLNKRNREITTSLFSKLKSYSQEEHAILLSKSIMFVGLSTNHLSW